MTSNWKKIDNAYTYNKCNQNILDWKYAKAYTDQYILDPVEFNTNNTEVTIIGLGSNSDAKLIATLTKSNVKSKIKEKKKINILTIVNSKFSQSGTGSTTLNDGLTYGTVYGTV